MQKHIRQNTTLAAACAAWTLAAMLFAAGIGKSASVPLRAEAGESCTTYADCDYGYICERDLTDSGSTAGTCALPGRRLSVILKTVSGSTRETVKGSSLEREARPLSERRLSRIKDLARSTRNDDEIEGAEVRTTKRISDQTVSQSARQKRLSRMLKLTLTGSVASTEVRETERILENITHEEWQRRYGTRFTQAMTGSSPLPYESEAAYKRRLRLLKRKLSVSEELSIKEEAVRPIIRSETSQ